MSSGNWSTITESQFAHEREALEFIRQGFPSYAPYLAWSNFEFTDDQGNIREIDLLTFSPQGVLLIEIKSWRGVISGDTNYWTSVYDGKRTSVDNPRNLANTKAKCLKKLLERQKCFRDANLDCPYIEAIVFLADQRVRVELTNPVGVVTRDDDNKPGILAAITRRGAGNLEPRQKPALDRSMMKAFRKAMEQIGVRPSNRSRRIGDYLLGKTIGEEPGYQDWFANHSSISKNSRRVRVYLVRDTQGKENRDLLERAAKREFQILESLSHPGILRAYNYSTHEMGPVVFFEAPGEAVRLDHYLMERNSSLSEGERLSLLRRIAEAVEYAHRKGVVHRALSPRNILVVDPTSEQPGVRLFNWQTGFRESSGTSVAISATSHVDQFIDDASTAYLAPEVYTDSSPNASLDVFSLGAIGYFLFTGQHPAENHTELLQKLQRDECLLVSSVLNGASPALDALIKDSTQGNVGYRTEGVDKFLQGLDSIEEDLTAPDNEFRGDPAQAQLHDILPGGYIVKRRLGQGATAVAYLVEQQGKLLVLKVASQAEYAARLEQEFSVLNQVHPHAHVVQPVNIVTISGRTALALEPVFVDTQKQVIETLAVRLGREGRLHTDLLERFGDDLLGVVCHLEDKGIFHRDIKPENIAVGQQAARRLHLKLFDFSLAGVPTSNIVAGTRRYLDPMLSLRERNCYDTAAERFAAAVTLYQMAAGIGSFPKWGDGRTEPTMLPAGTIATIDPELFEGDLRDGLCRFFAKAFHRDIAQRHHNAEEMRKEWMRLLVDPPKQTDPDLDDSSDTELSPLLDQAQLETSTSELGLSSRAINALDSANLLTVAQVLRYSVFHLNRLRGVGTKTRREISQAVKKLRDRLGTPVSANPIIDTVEDPDPALCPLSQAVNSVLRACTAQQRPVASLLLGLDDAEQLWATQSYVARKQSLTAGRIAQLLSSFRTKWIRLPVVTTLANQIVEHLESSRFGGVLTLNELADLFVTTRGGTGESERDRKNARALIRVATETELLNEEIRFIVRRDDRGVVLARDENLARLAFVLGARADDIAAQDPLLPQLRATEKLRSVPDGGMALAQLTDNRLLRLAAAASYRAVLSRRNELYPKNMECVRALRLSQGAIMGAKSPGVEDIRMRVASRYPDAQQLPQRPELDELIKQAGLGLTWEETANDGKGGYAGSGTTVSVSSASSSIVRRKTIDPNESDSGDSLESATARQFEERLNRSIYHPGFMTLLVNPRSFDAALRDLSRRFNVTLVDLEDLFLQAMRETATERKVSFDVVVRADSANRDNIEWTRLMQFVRYAVPRFEQLIDMACSVTSSSPADRVILMIYPGLLARYDQMSQLDRLIALAGRRDGLPALWLLLSGDQALIEGKPVPIISASNKAKIPTEWLENRHRAGSTTTTQNGPAVS